MSKLNKSIVFQTAFATYVASEKLGEGGAGEVYGATDEDGSRFAVKVLRCARGTSQQRRRFHNEINFLQRNSHPHLMQVVDAGVRTAAETSNPFYVMPRMDCSLRELRKEIADPELVLRIFGQILDGVEAAHLKQVFHRDLKPENVLANRATLRVVVADFGVAHFCEEEIFTTVETDPSERLANFAYAAPEQRQRGRMVDLRADIFSLGMILNELFTHELPLGTSYRRVGDAQRTLAFLDPIIEKMLASNPNDRPPTIEAVKSLIRRERDEFAVHQRISALDEQVIPSTATDDPLALAEVRVVDTHWAPNTLSFTLSQPVNERWHEALRRAVSRHLVGYGPREFSFRGATATVQCNASFAQQHGRRVVEDFKSWLGPTRIAYKDIVDSEARHAEAKLIAERSRQREAEEQALAINKALML